jgi:hypothetical protein
VSRQQTGLCGNPVDLPSSLPARSISHPGGESP